MRSDKLILAITLASSTAMAASTIEVTQDNSPYKLAADVTDVTQLSIAENCVLDLNGHTLIYSSAYGSGLSGLANHATSITNSSSTTQSVIAFRLNSNTSNLGTILSNVSFGGNLKVEVKGRSTSESQVQLFGTANTHTGGTTFDSYVTTSGLAGVFDSSKYGKISGDSPLGTGPFTLKNGSRVSVNDGNGSVMKWGKLVAENDSGNVSTNVLWLENRAVFSGPVEVAEGTTLAIAAKNAYSQFESDFSNVRGTLLLYDNDNPQSSGGLVDQGTTGFPNAKVRFADSQGVFQLRFQNSNVTETEIGEISTDDAVDGSRASAVVMNSDAGTTKTIKVGRLGTSTTFNGNFTKNNTAHIALEKVGGGTLTLGGTNTYDGVTTLTEGAIRLAGLGVMGQGSSAAIVFNGGTLAFADDVAVTDYSARIKNSTKAISIDAAKDVTWSTALPSSNIGGLVKKGAGKLAVAGYSSYTGKTIVSNGTLSVGFDYNGTKDGINREFEVEDGAKLEVTLRNTSSTRPSSDILTAFPNGTTVNLEATDVNKGYPRWDNLSNLGWNGTVNFANSSAMGTAGGFVASASTFGSSAIGWGVTGAPESLTRVVDFEYNENANINLGSFNWPSENAGIFVKRSGNWNIGGRNEPSLLNGRFLTNAGATLTINYNASSTLTIGSGFGAQLNEGQSGAEPKIVLNISNGSIVNNGDLSGATIKFLVNDITLSGSGSWPESMTLPASYKVAAVAPGETPETLDIDVDFSKATLANEPTAESVAGLSEDTSYTIFTAKSISNWTTRVINDDGHGKWKVVKQGNSLVLKYSKASFVIILR